MLRRASGLQLFSYVGRSKVDRPKIRTFTIRHDSEGRTAPSQSRDGDLTTAKIDPPIGPTVPSRRVVLPIPPVTQPSEAPGAGVKAAMGNGAHGIWTGTTFEPPPNTPPNLVFPARQASGRASASTSTRRDVLKERFCLDPKYYTSAASDPKTMMIYTDGACPFNGKEGAHAGFAFVFSPCVRHGEWDRVIEPEGTNRQALRPTNGRAELRAAVAALEFREWWTEGEGEDEEGSGGGWRRVVIATDSEYVGLGAMRMRDWSRKGWRNNKRKHIANLDLWLAFSAALGRYAEAGCEVSFWMVPREWNWRANVLAAKACSFVPAPRYTRVIGPATDAETEALESKEAMAAVTDAETQALAHKEMMDAADQTLESEEEMAAMIEAEVQAMELVDAEVQDLERRRKDLERRWIRGSQGS